MQSHKLKISFLGVLYTIVEVDKSIPDALTDKFIMKRLSIVDDALVSINLDGMLHITSKLYGENETTRFILVKFVPNMPHWTWKYFISSCVLMYVIIRLTIYYGLWSKFIELIKPVLDALL